MSDATLTGAIQKHAETSTSSQSSTCLSLSSSSSTSCLVGLAPMIFDDKHKLHSSSIKFFGPVADVEGKEYVLATACEIEPRDTHPRIELRVGCFTKVMPPNYHEPVEAILLELRASRIRTHTEAALVCWGMFSHSRVRVLRPNDVVCVACTCVCLLFDVVHWVRFFHRRSHPVNKRVKKRRPKRKKR